MSCQLHKKMSINDSSPCQRITIAVTPCPNSPDEIFNEFEIEPRSGSEKDTTCEEPTKLKRWLKQIQISIFCCIWLICCITLMSASENIQQTHQLSIPKKNLSRYILSEEPVDNKVTIIVEGAFLPPVYQNISTHWLYIWFRLIETDKYPEKDKIISTEDIKNVQNITAVWRIATVSDSLIGIVPELEMKKTFFINSSFLENTFSNHVIEILLQTNLDSNFPISLGYNSEPINTEAGIIYAALILLGLYLLIIFDLLHRTLAAMFASIISIALLAYFNAKPTMPDVMSWIDVGTLMLLFSMMVLVTITSETGIFDYMSVQAYRFTGGKIWPLVNWLCVITVLLSCFLDNVTTALLITPVTIKLSEVMKLNPIPVLICMILFSNVGGAITPIGDPPNVIIASNADVMKAGVTFTVFTLHMGGGTVLAIVTVYLMLRFYFYRDTKNFKYSEPREVQELKSKIAVWRRTAASVSSYSRDEEIVKETLVKRTARLLGKLASKQNNVTADQEDYNTNVEDLIKQYPIKDKVLLIKSGCALFLVICALFLQSVPSLNRLGLGWTTLLGALLLLLLYAKDDVEGIFARVEWSTLLFFASLFILMEALSRLGLIDWVGRQTQSIIMSVGEESRLTVAIILILWVSGIASAFVDNLPLTTMMIRIATDLSSKRGLNLPLQPLVWALSFGACLGANGSLFGSSSNIICAGVAEQHGYRLSFVKYLRVGVPVTVTTMTVVTVYLIVCHVVLQWH